MSVGKTRIRKPAKKRKGAGARSPSKQRKNWQAALRPDDKLEVSKWIFMTGLETVARIVASLADPSGERGQPEKPEVGLLVRIASLLRASERSLHSAASEVASQAHSTRKPHIALGSLVTKLERDFKAQRPLWLRMAKDRTAQTPAGPEQDERRQRERNMPPSADEYRVLRRLIEWHPDAAMDLYDWILKEAQSLHLGETDKWTEQEAKAIIAERTKLVKRAGRTVVEDLLRSDMRKLANTQGYEATFTAGPPRSFFELVEPSLMRLQGVAIRPPAS